MSDLFDDEGFSLSDINCTLLGEEAIQQQDDAYFLDDIGYDSDDDSAKKKQERKDKNGGDRLSMEEEIDLQRARVRNSS